MRKAWRWTKRVGLALLLAAAVLCVISEFRGARAMLWHQTGPAYGIGIARHTLIISYGDLGRPMIRWPNYNNLWHWQAETVLPLSKWSPPRYWLPGTSAHCVLDYGGYNSIAIPLWWVTVLAIGCAAFMSLHRGNRALRECSACRHDLRGLPKDAAVCPECGAGILSARP